MIWATLNDLKFKGYYLRFITDRFQKWERNLNIFLALTSSGSIAAWAIWDINPLIWAVIIALSQVLTVLKPYFPYFRYVKELNAKCLAIENLNLEVEHLWFRIQNSLIEESQALERYYEIKKEIVHVTSFDDETIFSDSKKAKNQANEKMRIFLKNQYGIDIVIN